MMLKKHIEERLALNKILGFNTFIGLDVDQIEELNRWDRQNLVNKNFDDLSDKQKLVWNKHLNYETEKHFSDRPW